MKSRAIDEVVEELNRDLISVSDTRLTWLGDLGFRGCL